MAKKQEDFPMKKIVIVLNVILVLFLFSCATDSSAGSDKGSTGDDWAELFEYFTVPEETDDGGMVFTLYKDYVFPTGELSDTEIEAMGAAVIVGFEYDSRYADNDDTLTVIFALDDDSLYTLSVNHMVYRSYMNDELDFDSFWDGVYEQTIAPDGSVSGGK
jgi:hypothetical protein